MSRHFLISLAAFAAVAAGVMPSAADAQVHQRHGVTGVGANQGAIRTPRFIVEAINFHVLDESGRDIPYSSDEVIAVFGDLTVNHNGQHYYVRTKEYDQVDTGDTRTFDYNQNCIVSVAEPTSVHHNTWLCDPHGAQAPLTFSIELFEADSAIREFPAPGFCVSGFTYGPNNQDVCHGNVLFDHTFTYSLSQLLPRMNNSCRCFTETAEWHADSLTAYQVSFRITRVDEQGPPLTVDPNAGSSGPTVLHTGSLTAHSGQSFELDGGVVLNSGGDLDFDRHLATFELDAPGSNGASIWVGGPSPRGYAACLAQRGTANYVSSAVTVPAVGNYACYVTDNGHVGEFRVDALSASANTLTITYTTWQ